MSDPFLEPKPPINVDEATVNNNDQIRRLEWTKTHNNQSKGGRTPK